MPFSSRREFAAILTGLTATRRVRAADPPLTVQGIEHVKLRVAGAPASALFYRSLFGGNVMRLQNSTLRSQAPTDEFFLKVGPGPYPYLMLAQTRSGEHPGLDHISLLLRDEVAARRALEAAGIPLYLPKEYGMRLRDPEGTLIELMPRPTWDVTSRAPKEPLPPQLEAVRPAFEPLRIERVSVRTGDVARSESYYRQLFGTLPFELRAYDRLTIAVRDFRPAEARRTLRQRGLQPYGSRNEVLLRDPDGNEIELA